MTMAECIEREALIEKLRTMPIPKQAGRANTWLDNCAAGVNAAIWEVASFPAADVAPVVHARWIYVEETLATSSGYCCSACRRPRWLSPDVPEVFKHCPKCGAIMDGGADHEAD